MKLSNHDEEKKKETRIALRDRNIFIAWKPEYESGILIIDEQHRGIVAAINSLYYAMQHGMGGVMLSHVVGMVTEYGKIHFRMEEEFHAKCGFPDDKQHRSLHLALIAETAVVGKRSIENHDPKEFLHFLKDWWVGHICHSDMDFKTHLKAMQ